MFSAHMPFRLRRLLPCLAAGLYALALGGCDRALGEQEATPFALVATQTPQPAAATVTPTPLPPSATPPPAARSLAPLTVAEVSRGSADQPRLALTFDCGSGAGPSAKILDVLRQHKLRVTFFMTGAYADRYPELVQRMAAEGHELANHTYSHLNFTRLSDAAIRDELNRTEAILQRLTGKSSKPWMRMPFGARDDHVLEVVKEAGYTSIFWTLDSGDWQGEATAQSVLRRVLNNAGNGFIVVHHCAATQTAEALPNIIQGLQERGLTIVTISELLGRPRAAASPNGNDLLALVTKERALPPDYTPPDLVELTVVPTTRSQVRLRGIAVAPLKAMLEEAKAHGQVVVALSGYRSYEEQARIFQGEVQQLGQAEASRVSARPGHSQHQLGTTVDFTSPSVNYGLTEAFGDTPEGRWLKDNAHRYGFVMSYPEGKESITGYAYEPWHYRYVGVEAATSVHQQGVTLDEFLAARR